MDVVAERRLKLASELARDVQHEYNNVVNVTYGYTQLLVRTPEDEIADQMMNALDRAVLLTNSFTYLTREPTPRVSALELSRLLLEVQALVNVFPKGKLEFEESPVRLLNLDKHSLFHLLVEMCLSLRGAGGRDVQLKVTSEVPGFSQLEDSVTLMLSAESCSFTPEDEVVYNTLCEQIGGQWRVTEGGFLVEVPGVEPVEEEAGVGVLVVVADDHKRAALVSSLEYFNVIDLDDSVVALSVFENNPDDFGVVVFDPDQASISARSFLLRIRSLRPQVKTLLIGNISGPALSDHSSTVEEVPAALQQLCLESAAISA